MKLTQKQIRFLRLRNSPKNDAWVTAGGDVVWSSDGNNLYVIGENSALATGDLSMPCGLLMGPSLQYSVPADDLSGAKDPTELIRRIGSTRQPILYRDSTRERLLRYTRWAQSIRLAEHGDPFGVIKLSFHSPITVKSKTKTIPALPGQRGAPEKTLPAKPIQKILENMKLHSIVSVGTTPRDPVYFFGVIDDTDAIAIVSPYK